MIQMIIVGLIFVVTSMLMFWRIATCDLTIETKTDFILMASGLLLAGTVGIALGVSILYGGA